MDWCVYPVIVNKDGQFIWINNTLITILLAFFELWALYCCEDSFHVFEFSFNYVPLPRYSIYSVYEELSNELLKKLLVSSIGIAIYLTRMGLMRNIMNGLSHWSLVYLTGGTDFNLECNFQSFGTGNYCNFF